MSLRRLGLFTLVLSQAMGCGGVLRKARSTAEDDGQKVIAALESHQNFNGEYPPSLDVIDVAGARIASMTYVRDGDSYTLVVSASSGRNGASCTRKAGESDWDCQRFRRK